MKTKWLVRTTKNETVNPKKHLWFFRIGAILLIFSSLTTLTFFVLGWDDQPPEVSDLQIHFQDIPEAENACTYFMKAEQFLFQNQDDETPSSSPSTPPTTQKIVKAGKERVRELMKKEDWPVEEILPLLEENQTFLALCERGVTCPYLQFPETKRVDDPMPVAGPLHFHGRLNALRASYIFQTGKETEAFGQAMEIIRFGQRIVNGQGNIHGYLVGLSYKRTGLWQIRRFLAQTTLPADALKSYLEELKRYSSTLDGWDTAIKYEYKMLSQNIDDMFSGKMGPPEVREEALKLRLGKFHYLLLPNHTKTLLAANCRTFIENGRKHFVDKTPLKPDETKARWKQMLTRNFIGKMLADIPVPSYERALGMKCHDNISIAATQCLIALKCYQLDHGGLPESLGKLVPAYLEAIPLDDFDGKPLRYNREKKILYSVGEDLVDNGGIENSKDRLKEIAYKIEF